MCIENGKDDYTVVRKNARTFTFACIHQSFQSKTSKMGKIYEDGTFGNTCVVDEKWEPEKVFSKLFQIALCREDACLPAVWAVGTQWSEVALVDQCVCTLAFWRRQSHRMDLCMTTGEEAKQCLCHGQVETLSPGPSSKTVVCDTA